MYKQTFIFIFLIFKIIPTSLGLVPHSSAAR